MLQSAFLKYNSDYNDLVRAYIGIMAFFRRYEQIEQAVKELVESGDRDAVDFIRGLASRAKRYMSSSVQKIL